MASACLDPAAEGVGSSRRAVVNGTDITGWDAVVALTADSAGPGFGGSMCTGTLLSSEWVLTAAHCLSQFADMGAPLNAMKIYVGYDATSDAIGSFPTIGELYQVAEAFPHPDFDSQQQSSGADIALIRLAERAEGKDTLALNRKDMTTGFTGVAPLYVGFGASDMAATTGQGIKRATNLQLTTVQATSYQSYGAQSSICRGDSGGPGLLIIDEVDSVVGVNSVLIGDRTNPCTGQSIQTRVDVYVPWLEGIINDTHATCDTDADFCLCAAACKVDGFCDNSVCRELSCDEVDQCVIACADDAACAQRCYERATLDGRKQLNALLACNHENCEELEDDAWKTCVDTKCSAQVEACFPRVTGNDSCLQIHYCMSACAADNSSCQQGCFESGSAQAQDDFNGLAGCLSDKCGEISSQEEWNTCVEQTCVNEANTCGLYQGCEIGADECKDGAACMPGAAGTTACFPSAGGAQDAPCDPQQFDPVPCDDALLCWGETSTCRPLCQGESDCAADEDCHDVFLPGHEGLGVCAPAGTVAPTTDGGVSAGDGQTGPLPGPTTSGGGGCAVVGDLGLGGGLSLMGLLLLLAIGRRRR